MKSFFLLPDVRRSSLVRCAPLLATLAMPVLASAAAAEVSVGAAAWAEPRFGEARISPVWSAQSASGTLGLRGLLVAGEQSLGYRGLGLEANQWLTTSGPFRGEIVSRVAHTDRFHGVFLARGALRAHLGGQAGGAWAGLAVESVNGIHDRGMAPLLELGAWTRAHGITMFWELEQGSGILAAPGGSDTTDSDTSRAAGPGRDGGPTGLEAFSAGPDADAYATTFTTLRTRLHWQRSRLEVESTAGISFSLVAPTRRWAHTQVSYRWLEPLTLFATFGNKSGEPSVVPSAEPRAATVGVRLSNWRPETRGGPPTLPHVQTLRLLPGGAGQYVLEVKAPGARRVEIMGDLSNWLPIALDPVASDRFRIALAPSPGPHTISVRVDDGPWLAPPGLPRAPDGVDGSAGVLLIP